MFIEQLLCAEPLSPPEADAWVVIGGSPYNGLGAFVKGKKRQIWVFSGSASTDPRTTWQCLLAKTASPMDEAGVCAIAGTSLTWLVLLTGRSLSLSIRCPSPDHLEVLLPHTGSLHPSLLIWFRHWFWEQADLHVPLIFHCSSHRPHIDCRLG